MTNTLKTTLLLGVLSGLFLLIGEVLGGAQGVIIAFLFAAVTNLVSYWFSDRIVLAMYRAKEVGYGPSALPAGGGARAARRSCRCRAFTSSPTHPRTRSRRAGTRRTRRLPPRKASSRCLDREETGRRARARARPRQTSGHPHQLGRRDAAPQRS
jgi:hypothetical protein